VVRAIDPAWRIVRVVAGFSVREPAVAGFSDLAEAPGIDPAFGPAGTTRAWVRVGRVYGLAGAIIPSDPEGTVDLASHLAATVALGSVPVAATTPSDPEGTVVLE
jgi:hypothetical protein